MRIYDWRNSIRTVEFLILISFVFIIYRLSGPVLEGFGIAAALKNNSYAVFFPNLASRPLGLVPSYIATKIGGIGTYGYAFVEIAMSIARVLTFRMINRKFSLKYYFILVFLPPWFSVTNERYIGPLFSVNFLLLAFVFLLKKRKMNLISICFMGTASLVYPPSLFVIPMVLFALKIGKSDVFNFRNIKELCFVFLGLSIPFVSYFLLVLQYPTSYDSKFAKFTLIDSFHQLFNSIVFTYKVQTVLLIIIVVSTVMTGQFTNIQILRKSFVIILSLILTALAYSQSVYHLRDSDRIFFPISVALMLFVIGCSQDDDSPRKVTRNEYLKRLFWVFFSVFYILKLFSYWYPVMEINRTTLSYVLHRTDLIDHPFRVILVDKTGLLGDVNTLYDSVLFSAIQYGNNYVISAEICTPSGVSRHHPVANRFPLPTTRDCEAVPKAGDQLVFTLESSKPFLMLEAKNRH